MIDYVSSKYPFLDRGEPDLYAQLLDIMSRRGTLFQDPVLQLVRSRKNQKFDWSTFSSELRPKRTFDPYIHQIKAWENIVGEIPTVVSTGTGSGKSESFMFPLLDGLIKAGFGGKRKVGAICLYPMNALVEDQYGRMKKMLEGSSLTVGIYNGSYKNKDGSVDVEKPETIPNVLLTNYKMLEYMLLRSKDHVLFEDIELRYLVLDEAHTYTGTLGLEVACLLSRLRVHLGSPTQKFLPIATSATLMQNSQSDRLADMSRHREEMRLFFSKLFGVEFPKDENWLIEDEFEELPSLEKNLFAKTCAVDEAKVKSALERSLPEALKSLSEIYFNIKLNWDTAKDTLTNYNEWAGHIFDASLPFAKQLPGVVLTDDAKDKADAVVMWEKAAQRFISKLGLSSCHLEALLMLCSQAYQNPKFPALGIRLHAFGKSEPRVFWSFDKKNLYDENMLDIISKGATDYISCTKCGHSAWAGIFVREGGVSGDEGRLHTLPVFYENAEIASGAEMLILHDKDDVSSEVMEREGWGHEVFELDPSDSARRVIRLSAKRTVKSPMKEFWRIVRKSKDSEASDARSCPACGSTSSEHNRPVMLTPRSGVATNISVYSASLMTAMDIPQERRMLIFSDNRQETSFLSGFLSDRHRRFNLRRAVASFLKQAGPHSAWKLFAKIDTSIAPEGHKYDLAARILLSVHGKAYWGEKELPKKSPKISRSLLQDLIPRDVLEVDYFDLKDPAQKVNNEHKVWLLNNFSERQLTKEAKDVFEEVELFSTERGHWCLRLFTEVILVELSSMIAREGNLQAIGLAAWDLESFGNMDAFEKYAQENPQLKMGGRALMYISYWLLERLASWGQWRQLDDSTRRHALGKKGVTELQTLANLVSKGLDKKKPMQKNAKIARIITELGGDEALAIWSKSSTWALLIHDGPLEPFVSMNDDQIPRIKTEKVRIVSDPKSFRGSLSGQIASVASNIDLAYLPTGRKGDNWQAIVLSEHPYYQALYQRSFDEEFRLVRASEHNGMIAGDRAAQVIEDFKDQKINALVATPTLEMGVDLPDLPVVIHRSVPPDPSNYAQRAGRAGRDPKRALIVTHCGFGSHDLTFYEHPDQMVSGEILPPGLPNENISILQRHVQGLVLELLAIRFPEFKHHFEFTWWGQLVDLSDLKRQYLEIANDEDKEGLPEVERPVKWELILDERKDLIRQRVLAFIAILERSLWANLDPSRKEDLRRRVLRIGEPSEWALAFRSQLDRYLNRAQLLMKDFADLKGRARSTNQSRESEIARQFARANKLARMYITNNQNNYPLSYLGANGFLPNFDFPGKVVRFNGVLPQYNDRGKRYVSKDDRYMSFTRPASVALREFAPEQTIYGQGFIYKVDRYVTESIDEHDGKAWGVCENGCSELTPPGQPCCQFCEGGLIRAGDETAEQPRLLEVQEAQGMQVSVISDQQSKREFNPVVKEVRRLGLPNTSEAYSLKDMPDFGWSLYLGVSDQIQNVIFLKGRSRQTDHGMRIEPLFKERSDGESRVFGVKAQVAEKERSQWEPFLPAVFSKSQGMRISLPYETAIEKGLITDCVSNEESKNSYYRSFSALLERAATRVLRLNKRKGSLTYVDDEIKIRLGNGEYTTRSRSLLILDNEEGGSGIIELIWTYWDQIMAEASRLVIQDCCNTACYRCLKSYDNQMDHDLLNKEIFLRVSSSQRSAPLFEIFRRSKNGSENVLRLDAALPRNVDVTSPAEKALDTYLQQHYPLARSTQQSIEDLQGKEVTRPDFVLTARSGEEVMVFVDGHKHHGNSKTFLADIEKRNFLTKQGGRSLTIPACLCVPVLKEKAINHILSPLLKEVVFELPRTGNKVERFPAAWTMEESSWSRVQLNGHQASGWEELDRDVLKGLLAAGLFGQAREHTLDPWLSLIQLDDLPVAHQKGVLLMPVHGNAISAERGKEKWEALLIMHSLFAAIGYRLLYLWIGKRPD